MTNSNISGTYAAVKFNTDTNKAIHRYVHDNKLPNAVRPDQLHTTLIFSRTHMPAFVAVGKLSSAIRGVPTQLDVWNSAGGERCLVLRYRCDALIERHNELMIAHNGTYDFAEYIPHITLSYDIGSMDISQLLNIHEYLNDIVIVEEYGEDLKLDWNTAVVTINKGKKV